MPNHDEFFDVYYDISESLFDRIRSLMDQCYRAEPRTAADLDALKTIRDHIVRAPRWKVLRRKAFTASLRTFGTGKMRPEQAASP